MPYRSNFVDQEIYWPHTPKLKPVINIERKRFLFIIPYISFSMGFTLVEDFEYFCKSYKYICPKGMFIDGASIPALFWIIIGNPFGIYFLESIPHDAGYKGKLQEYSLSGVLIREGSEFTKSEVDTLFHVLLKNNVLLKTWRTFLIYNAVRFFGSSTWNGYRKNLQKK